MDLVDAARLEPSRLVLSVQVGQRLGRDLRDPHPRQRRLDVASVRPAVAVDRVRRPALSFELKDPLLEEVAHRCVGAVVLAVARFDQQLRPGELRLTQRAVERATRLATTAGDRIAARLHDQLPHPR